MNKVIYLFVLFVMFFSCGRGKYVIDEQTEHAVTIVPDYTYVTIPPNIASLNFLLKDDSVSSSVDSYAIFENEGGQRFEVDSKNGFFCIPQKKWKTLLSASIGKKIKITVVYNENGIWKAYRPFDINIAAEPVDKWMAYRLIEPGYALWNKMGIYQRNLETYDEYAIYENKMTEYNCVNCHSFCNRNPNKMFFHMRAKYPGTVIIDENKIEILNTKTDKTISALVYPSWHPSGDFVAFSVNKTSQGFHAKQRVEVYDMASDVVVYDIKNHNILTTDAVFSKDNFETFPTFSADGKTLYYCVAPACPMPDSVAELRYSLCSIAFDAAIGKFGNVVDTLINANIENKSVSFPRVSPDGKYLVCTVSSYGTFPIWHKDADLYMINLKTREGRYMDVANSDDVDSYHSWSSNSHWLIFSSRRMDGLYTRPYIAYIDSDGCESKPFVIPQKDVDFYLALTKSYNIPEFITDKVPDNAYKISNLAKKEDAVGVSFAKK